MMIGTINLVDNLDLTYLSLTVFLLSEAESSGLKINMELFNF